jgi:hypothetical protein
MKKPSQLTLDEWTLLYPKYTMKQIAEQLQCGETTVHKWLKRVGIGATKKNRNARSEEHRKKISDANKGKIKNKTGKFNACEVCGKEYYVIPARARITRFCSTRCKGIFISKNSIGSLHPRYIQNVAREKICEGCGCLMVHKSPQPITSFLLQKFCTKTCADENGLRYFGEENKKYKGDAARRKNRTSQHSRWATKVIQRDLYKCMRCGVSGEDATLQAHHIFPFELFPAKRNEISNGITLCSKCHWEVHDTLEEKYIHTTNEQKVQRLAKRKKAVIVIGEVVEGKVFGRDSRKWRGSCYWCSSLVVKRISDVVGKRSVFCSLDCRNKHYSVFKHYKEANAHLVPSTAKPPEKTPLN